MGSSEDEEKQKEKEKAQIRQEISYQQRKLEESKNSRKQYNTMRTTINTSVLIKLEEAKGYLEKSRQALKSAYISQQATMKDSEYEDLIQNIKDIINNLNDPILVEINNKIKSLDEDISYRNNTISNLNYNLRTI